MRRKGLFSKMVATYSLIIAISFIILASFLSFWFERYFLDQRKGQLLDESHIVSNAALQYLHGNSSLDKTNDILEYVSNYAGADILLFDRYGYVYGASNPMDKGLIGNQLLTEELHKLRQGNFIEKRNLNDNLKKTYVYNIPIFYRGIFQGAVGFSTSMELINAPIRRVYQIIWISAIFAIICSSIIIYYFSQKIIIKPLEKINNAADKISKGEVKKRVEVRSSDEIGALANSFNCMADSLEKVEENRRIFISNVSHELRSPITSIKGFIGGVLDGVIPEEKEKYYLSIAYEEIQRLTRLINDLLDLSAIEAGKFDLNIKEEDINEIIRISIIKFQTIIKAKNINVEVWLNEESVYVLVDRDKIVQVMTNLIDNAIKYGKDKGKIEISIKAKGQEVFVSIYNDGSNIPEEDAKYIWDRFYKGDKSRTLKMSTGLGLSIVRRIVTEHGGDIWFENKEKKGVKFIFSLKKSHK